MKPVWTPSEAYTRGSHLERLMRRLELPDYDALYAFSVERPDAFWKATLELMGIEWFEPYERYVDLSRGVMWPEWFPGGKLNLAHNATTRHARGERARQLALIWEGENGAVVRLTYRELDQQVAQAAAALRELGVGRGDRVGLFLPMLPETAVAFLATARIGAIAIPIFSGYGAEATATRLADAGARLLVTADGFLRRGRVVPMKPVADEALERAPSVEKVLVVRRVDGGYPMKEGRDLWWDEAVGRRPSDAPTEVMGSMDPFMLIYTSGTTGRPKGTVHYHAGFPLKAAQDMAHLFDLRPGELMFWFTDMGWMMGPWAILGSLLLGSTVFLYEGAPDYPGPDRLWQMVARHGITHLGISPTLIRALIPYGEEPVKKHDLSSLRVLGSTGEPWNPEPYQWFFQTVGGGRCPIVNYSGGTEVSGGILGCTVYKPIAEASFNTPAPGIKAAVLNDEGEPVVGQVGELAVLAPWPGMTKGFWNDPERYERTYWSRFKDVWVHGDWALVDEEGYWFILGRSDDTLKIAGKRVGPAELESAAIRHPAVQEAGAVGVPHEVKGEVPVLFVVLRPEFEGSEELAAEIAEKVAEVLGKPMKPAAVHFVSDLPKTRNAKVMRRLLKAAYLGESTGDTSALVNPEVLDEVRRLGK
ncbi:AMP-binding protein [Oceanithermus desulfurans]|uniref:acetate--CoA ligase n=2 Tax=Oceanithermus desulfurans TaxID=227924 RepID=A0A511RJ66_9DEIN|nr:AMP-binding protein [Oceanithermus desulfurans]MBB6028807.1 acetyl-CoA synthetase [Oceanithermus desulfurans]GEM88866.1 AMP-dependent synthetase [Oceanithermus desulfurans NBRC 100063]